MADVEDEISSCFEALTKRVLAKEWRALYASYDPAKADKFLIGAAAAAGAHVADGGEGRTELQALHAADGGPLESEGWPASVKDKARLFESLMRFSEKFENHHSAIPMIDWEEASLQDIERVSATSATAAIVVEEKRTDVTFTRHGDGWHWAFAGDSVCLWSDHDPNHNHHGPAASPEDDMHMAEEAIEKGELPHAAKHVAGALAVDPSRREWREALDRLADQAKVPHELFPVEKEKPAWFGEIAGHAHVLAHLGDTQKAIDLLAQVAAYTPRRRYTLWLAEWLGRHKGRFDPRGLLGAISNVCSGTIGFLRLRPTERAMFENWAPVALALLARPKSDELRPETLGLASGLLRRAGRFEEAEKVARAGVAASSSTLPLIALGLALRGRGEWDAALEVFRGAKKADPTAPFAAECVRVLVDAGRLEEAAREMPPASDEDIEMGVCRAWLAKKAPAPAKTGWLKRVFTSEPKLRPEFVECAKRLPEKCDSDTFRQISLHAAPGLPIPVDATANMLLQVREEKLAKGDKTTGGLKSIALTCLEPPSGRLALALENGGDGSDLSVVEYKASQIPKPDPRLPRRPVRDVIWMYFGPEKLDVRQIVAAPSAEVARAVTALATSHYFLSSWWSAAKKAGPELGVSRVDDILGAMVRPPRPPAEIDSVEWVFRHQVAGAFLLAHIDDGWRGSRRREVLFSLVDGVMDWTTDAAILALRELALDEPEALDEIEERFWTLRGEVPQPGGPWFLDTLGWSYLRLPGVPLDRRGAFEKDLQELHGEGQ